MNEVDISAQTEKQWEEMCKDEQRTPEVILSRAIQLRKVILEHVVEGGKLLIQDKNGKYTHIVETTI